MDRKDKQSSYGASSQSSSTMRATPQPSPTVRLPPRFGTSIFVNGTKPNSPFAANSPSTPLASIKKEEGMSASPKEGERFAHDQIIDFGTKVKTVRVGTDEDHIDYTVHESLLRRTPYFRDMLPLQTIVVHISEGKPTSFGIYVQWLYSGRLHTKIVKGSAAITDPIHKQEWFKLVDGYLIGERLADAEFRDTVMDAMLDWCKEATTQDHKALLENVGDIYSSCHAGSHLRQLVSDIAAWHFDDSAIQEMRIDDEVTLPYGFLPDTLCGLSKRMQGRGQNPFGFGTRSPVDEGRGTCKYHCHGDKACYKQIE